MFRSLWSRAAAHDRPTTAIRRSSSQPRGVFRAAAVADRCFDCDVINRCLRSDVVTRPDVTQVALCRDAPSSVVELRQPPETVVPSRVYIPSPRPVVFPTRLPDLILKNSPSSVFSGCPAFVDRKRKYFSPVQSNFFPGGVFSARISCVFIITSSLCHRSCNCLLFFFFAF